MRVCVAVSTGFNWLEPTHGLSAVDEAVLVQSCASRANIKKMQGRRRDTDVQRMTPPPACTSLMTTSCDRSGVTASY